MAELKNATGSPVAAASSPLAATPSGEGALRVPPLKMGALTAAPDGAPIADRVAPLFKASDRSGDTVAVVKAATNSAASTLQGRDVSLIADTASRLGVEVTESTSSTGRRALVLEGDNPSVMGVVRMAKAIKEDRAARPFLVGYSAMGPVYQVGPHLIAAPGGLVAVRRDGAQITAIGVIAPAGAAEGVAAFVSAAAAATEGIING